MEENSNQLSQIAAAIPECMLCDQPGFRQRLARIHKRIKQGRPVDKELVALTDSLAISRKRCAHRKACLPSPSYPEELPVSEMRDEIAQTIINNQVVVIAGETGSGKTTQLPKICLELGRGVHGLIGHTQPRRIAARSVAERIASELKSELGHAVGYQVRFHGKVSRDSYVKLMTDGILLAEIQKDHDLLQYDTIIIDEAHERSLNIDFILGYMKQLLPRRPDLKLLITSATIDTERFSRHFSDAPIVEVTGRTYPVEIRYHPAQSNDDESGQDRVQSILDAVDELTHIDRGDILVFLSGEREIRETAEALRKHHPPQTEIFPLFSRLSVAEQNRVFQTHRHQRIVLATNVAETSLTVPGIRYVIDPGFARISRYSYRSKVQRLPVERISQASANQRAGRCGRVSAGVCVRLYSEEDFLNQSEFTEPEIQRTNLAAVILQMKMLGLGDVERFPFVDVPDQRYINDGYRLLQELGAVDRQQNLTEIGRDLGRFPVDPRIARMLLAAKDEHCLEEILIIASALTVQDPRERPMDKQQKADLAHSEFKDDTSDFLGWLKLWSVYHEQARHLSKNKARTWCRQHFLAPSRMQEWHDVHQLLKRQISDMGVQVNQTPADPDAIHMALLHGLLSNAGFKEEGAEYTGSHDKKFMIFPGSALFKEKPKWLMSAEIVETSRLYARTVASIKPEWLEKAASHLVKRSYSEPHWQKNRAQVAAYESVSLYGLVLITGRKINYGPVNPVEAREIFIRSALVDGNYRTNAGFFSHNRSLLNDVQLLEDKSRRRDIMVDEEDLVAFYDERIPEGIYSGKSFETWRKHAEREDSKILLMDKDYLMQHNAKEITTDLFPDELCVKGIRLKVEYHFEPGSDRDGVTLGIPLPALNQLQNSDFEWLVPGLLEEKITALIKSLPKNLRRNFVPAPEYAKACMEVISTVDGTLTEAVSGQLRRMSGIEIPKDAWREDKIPVHLRMNFSIVDQNQKEISIGRDLQELQHQLGDSVKESFIEVKDQDFEQENITEWDFDDLPEEIEVNQNGIAFTVYPALAEEKNGNDITLALRQFETQEMATTSMRSGLRRLFMIQQQKEVKYLLKNLPSIEKMCMQYASLGKCEDLKHDLLIAGIDRAMFEGLVDEVEVIRSKSQYEQCRNMALKYMITRTNDLCEKVQDVLSEYSTVAKSIKGSIPATWLNAVADIREQLESLVFQGFVQKIPFQYLEHYPRYLKAIQLRLKKLEENPSRDRLAMLEFSPLRERYLSRLRKSNRSDSGNHELEIYRWMLEELRVSMHAQELKTPYPVSVKRLEKQWDKVSCGV